jgi:cytoskeletal protein CcmA (bactofilin family)
MVFIFCEKAFPFEKISQTIRVLIKKSLENFFSFLFLKWTTNINRKPRDFLFTKDNLKASPEESISFVGEETVFEGKMSFEGVFRLEGKFNGEITGRGKLIVGESAVVKAKIEVNAIFIHGLVEGEISVKERADIHSTGKLLGNILTPIITINEGGIFEGHCKMGRDTCG